MVFIDEEMMDEYKKMRELMNKFAGYGLSTARKAVPVKRIPTYRSPVCDVFEEEGQLKARFELPGIEKKDIELNVTDDSIEVSVKQKAKTETKKKGYYRCESRTQSFFRRVPLPTDVVASKVSAEFKDGVLEVTMPKRKQIAEKKKILIK